MQHLATISNSNRLLFQRAILGPQEQEPDNISFSIVLEKKTYKFQGH